MTDSTQQAKPNARVSVGNVTFANDAPISVLAGPCQMESRAHALEMASALKEICGRLGIGFGRAREPIARRGRVGALALRELGHEPAEAGIARFSGGLDVAPRFAPQLGLERRAGQRARMVGAVRPLRRFRFARLGPGPARGAARARALGHGSGCRCRGRR